ncbi:MAG: substrate-binding domain-containing protein [Oscillospiraceae bacterium]
MSLAGCSGNGTPSEDDAFDGESDIAVISREDGSGTRGAFIELFSVEKKDANGDKVDMTTDSADITNSTSVMLTSVAGNPAAIGYVSLGSLSDSVKALKIDGTILSIENVKNGSYKISRPFNIVTKDKSSEVSADFIGYILSADGQSIVEKSGYIAIDSAAAPYSGTKPSGKAVVAGSSSVTPVMEKLKEAYLAINPNAVIEIQMSDSTTGITGTLDGICDIGMASRELKDSELSKGLVPTVIALDGIAVIVNKENPLESASAEQVMDIYTGKSVVWNDVLGE